MPRIALSDGQEFDEVELLQARQLQGIVKKIAATPKGKLELQRLHRSVDPAAPAAELDALSAAEEKVTGVSKEIEELRKELAAEKQENTRKQQLAELHTRVEAGIKKLRDAGWTDDGIKGVRELMEAKGLLDAEDAAAIFEKQHPPPTPIVPTAGSGSWDFIGSTEVGSDETLKRLVAARGESEGVTDQMVRDILHDVRGQPRR